MCDCENGCEYCDEAFQSDMRELRKEQLRTDISPEEALEDMEFFQDDHPLSVE